MTNFSDWMDHYNRWLKIMYLEFKHLCSKYDKYGKYEIYDMKQQDYYSFCLLLYKHTSEKNKIIN